MNTSARVKLSKRIATGVGHLVYAHPWSLLLLTALLGGLDYLTGHELSLGIVYLMPIALAAWWQPKRWIVGVS